MKTIFLTLSGLSLVLGSISCSVTEPHSVSNEHTSAVAKRLVNTNSKGLALEGYDPVVYFTDKKPAQGRPEFTAVHEGATYHFATATHRKMFIEKPASYAPAYGGYCGYAASIGKVRPVRPEFWSIVNGKLILQHSKEAVELWEKDVTGNKTKADTYWPRLVTAKADNKNPVDSLLGQSILPDVR